MIAGMGTPEWGLHDMERLTAVPAVRQRQPAWIPPREMSQRDHSTTATDGGLTVRGRALTGS